MKKLSFFIFIFLVFYSCATVEKPKPIGAEIPFIITDALQGIVDNLNSDTAVVSEKK